MKILWLTTIFDDSAVSSILLNILPHFSSDISITVVSLESTFNIKSQSLNTLQKMNINHTSLNCSKKNFLQSGKKLDALISEIEPDVVHAQLGRAYIALLLSKYKKKEYVKLATFHNNANYFNKITYYILKLLYKKFNAVTAVSKSCLETIQHSFDSIKRVPTHVIYNPIVHHKTLPITYQKSKDVSAHAILIVVGRLVQGKGHDLWVLALPHIQKKFDSISHTFELWCAGTGILHDTIVESYSKLGFAHHVKMLGYRQDIYTLMKQADIVLFPSQDEGFGLVPCEAILCGTPVVTHDLPVMRELLQNDAYITNCRNPEAFADTIFHVFTNPQLYHTHIQKSQKEIMQNFSVEKIALEYEKLYHSLVDTHKTKPKIKDYDIN